MTVTYRFWGIWSLLVALGWVRLRHVHVEVRPRRPGHPPIISSCSLRPSQSHGSCRLAITIENGELFRAAQKSSQIWRNWLRIGRAEMLAIFDGYGQTARSMALYWPPRAERHDERVLRSSRARMGIHIYIIGLCGCAEAPRGIKGMYLEYICV